VDYFSNLIDSRIAQQTKNQFMKTQPATVINNGSVDQMKVVRLLATGATVELLNMTGVDLSVGDQVQVYSCGKTMYIGASSNTGRVYRAGANINITSINGYNTIRSIRKVGLATGLSTTGNWASGWTFYWSNISGITRFVDTADQYKGWLINFTFGDEYPYDDGINAYYEYQFCFFGKDGQTISTADPSNPSSSGYLGNINAVSRFYGIRNTDYYVDNPSAINYLGYNIYAHFEGFWQALLPANPLRIFIPPRYKNVGGVVSKIQTTPQNPRAWVTLLD
jgi:hypothetical protein